MNSTKSLQDILHDLIVRVPDYQRGFAWEKEHVQDFLNDLELLGSGRRHYTGTLVLHQPPNYETREAADGKKYSVVDIVDGQQRLTTIIILLNELSGALRAYPNSQDLAEAIRRLYIETVGRDGQPIYKLLMNADTDTFFKSRILRETPSVVGNEVMSAQRLLDARDKIAEHLDAIGSDTGREQELHNLYFKVIDQLHFNLYLVDNESEVGVIFEVMNDRGKSLTDMEKLKNYLLHIASTLDLSDASRNDFTKCVNDTWSYIFRQLLGTELDRPSDEDQLLRMHWFMQYNPDPKQWNGSKSIRQQFSLRRYQGRRELLSALRRYVEELREACTAFCDARRPSSSGSFRGVEGEIRKDIRYWSSKFVRIGATANLLPLLMAVRVRWAAEPEKYLEIVQLCEKFSFRVYRVGEFRANFSRNALYRIANAIFRGAEFDDVIQRVKQHMRIHYAVRRFGDFWTGEQWPKYGWDEWSGLKYFLYEYEMSLAEANRASPIEWDDLLKVPKDTIEHILPQSIHGQPSWEDSFSAEQHSYYVHDIGNLVLTRHNSHYSNKSFDRKKGTVHSKGACYARSPLLQERELAEYADWTPEAIDKRRGKLFDWASKRWSVDFGDMEGAPVTHDEVAGDELEDNDSE